MSFNRPLSLLLLVGAVGVCAPIPLAQESSEARIRSNLVDGIGQKIRAGSVSSLTEAEQSAEAFNTYLWQRTGHALSEDTVTRLARAEWAARLQGRGTIPLEQFCEVANRSVVAMLGSAEAARAEYTVGNPYYLMTLEKLNGARLFYRVNAPDVTASTLSPSVIDFSAKSAEPGVKEAFPLETLIAFYTSVSGDLGYGQTALNERWSRTRPALETSAGPQGRPFGEHGWAVRRPVSKLLTDDLVNAMLDISR